MNYATRGAPVPLTRSRLTIAAIIISALPPTLLLSARIAAHAAPRVLDLLDSITFGLAAPIFGITLLVSWPLGLVLGILASLRESRPFGFPQAAIVLLTVATPIILLLLAMMSP